MGSPGSRLSGQFLARPPYVPFGAVGGPLPIAVMLDQPHQEQRFITPGKPITRVLR